MKDPIVERICEQHAGSGNVIIHLKGRAHELYTDKESWKQQCDELRKQLLLKTEQYETIVRFIKDINRI